MSAEPTDIPMLVGPCIKATYWFTASTSLANPAVRILSVMAFRFFHLKRQGKGLSFGFQH